MKQRSSDIERLKGLLIALVVLGHNTLFSEWSERAFILLYNFHVACFLLLPFLFSPGILTPRWIVDRAVRYLVPQFVFFALTCIAYFIVFVPGSVSAVISWLQSVVLAVVLSSETTYENAAGFRIFWFLPALFTLVVIRAMYVGAGRGAKMTILAVALATHLFLGLLPPSWLMYVPWGLPIVLFVFPVGLLLAGVWERYKVSVSKQVVAVAVFAACAVLSMYWPSHIGLAGEPGVYSLLEIERLLFHDVFLLSAFLGLWAVCRWLPVKILETLGAASLLILLTHGLIWQSLRMTGVVAWIEHAIPVQGLAVAAGYVLTLALCLAVYFTLRHLPALWNVLFPSTWSEWVAALTMERKARA